MGDIFSGQYFVQVYFAPIILITIFHNVSACSSSAKPDAIDKRPHCEPRPTIQQIQDPRDLQLGLKVIPDQIIVNKCSGSCQDSNLHYSCKASKKQTKTIKTVHESYLGRNQNSCYSVEIEEDIECQCGCRISESDCNSIQVISVSVLYKFMDKQSRNLSFLKISYDSTSNVHARL